MRTGLYKDGKYRIDYWEDGTKVQSIPHPRDFGNDNSAWDNLPDGKLPEPEYVNPLSNCRIEFIDFGVTPAEIISLEEMNRRLNNE